MSALKPCLGPGERLEPTAYKHRPNLQHDAKQAVRAEQAMEAFRALPWYKRLWCFLFDNPKEV